MNSINQDLDRLDEATSLLFQFLKRPSTWSAMSSKVATKINRPGAAIVKTLLSHPAPLLSVTKLANILCVEAPSISRKVSELEKAGLVKRIHKGDDKRTVYLQATLKAEKLNHQLGLARRELYKTVLANWKESDRKTFVKLFLRYANELKGEES